MFFSPPTKTRAPRKYWYLLRTPAGDCIVWATCAGVRPAQIQRCKTALWRAGSSVQIKRIHSRDAYRAIRSGIPACTWDDKLRFVHEILLNFYTRGEVTDCIHGLHDFPIARKVSRNE